MVVFSFFLFPMFILIFYSSHKIMLVISLEVLFFLVLIGIFFGSLSSSFYYHLVMLFMVMLVLNSCLLLTFLISCSRNNSFSSFSYFNLI